MEGQKVQGAFNEMWTLETWRNWLKSQGLDDRVASDMSLQSVRAAKNIARAWSFALGAASIAATASLLILGWTFEESISLKDLVGLVVLANVLVLAVWFGAYHKIGMSQQSRAAHLQHEIAVAAGESAANACADFLNKRKHEIADAAAQAKESTDRSLNDAIRLTFQNLSIEQLQEHLLRKFAGARFVAAGSDDVQIFFANKKCARCATELRSSEVHRFAIEVLRAQAAGLTRAESVLACGVEMQFLGDRQRFESFFRRGPTESESYLARMGAIQYEYCDACKEVGLTSGVLHEIRRGLTPDPDFGAGVIDEDAPRI